MRRMIALLLVLLLPLTAWAETMCRVPQAMLPDTWLTASFSPEESELVAVLTEPAGWLLLQQGTLMPRKQGPVLQAVVTAALRDDEAAPDMEGRYTAGGRDIRWQRTGDTLVAAFDTQKYTITLTITAAPDAADRALLRQLPVLLTAIRLVGETDPMPMDGLSWGMDEEQLTELLGLPVYAVPLAGDGWEGLEYIPQLLGAEVAEMDCCMRDGRLTMLLVGLEETDPARVVALLTDELGDPEAAGPEDVGRVLTPLLGGDAFDGAAMALDAVIIRHSGAQVLVFPFAGVVMVAYLDPIATIQE